MDDMLYKFNKKNFKYTPVNEVKYFYSIVFGTIGVILFTFVITSFMYNTNKTKEYMESEVVINLVTNESFSKEKFISEVKLSRFKYPDIIIAQAYIETSHFSSQVWEQNRNDELIHTRQEITNTNINHLLKQHKRSKYELYDLVKQSIKVFELDQATFDKSIDYMVLMDYIKFDNQSFKTIIRNFSKKITQNRDIYLKKINIDINDWIVGNYTQDKLDKLEKDIFANIK